MIGFIGGGNMAEAIFRGLGHRAKDMGVSDMKPERLNYLKETYGVRIFDDNISLVEVSDVVVLAVKPQVVEEVLQEVSSHLRDRLLISIAAGIGLDYLIKKVGHGRVIRVMPNTAAFVRQAISAISPGPEATDEDIAMAKDLFGAIGQVLIMKESLMDAVTALSGSGPAFVAYFIQALIESGIREGLSLEEAKVLVLQTVKGTVGLIESGLAPQEVINMVSSPAGTTVEGIYALDHGGLRATVKNAIRVARERSEKLRR